ncbi:MAG: ABC transporter ATP-binding protein [Lactobacillaceae bacterium]
MAYIEVKHLKKVYENGEGVQTEALKDINFTVEKGDFISIMGDSGSGKSTLLNILSCIDYPSSGSIIINHHYLEDIKNDESTKFRNRHIGFIFQNFNLLNIFSNKENILMPVIISGRKIDEYETALKGLAISMGIENILNRYPYELSGGQKQRIAIARALIMDPDLVLADELTGQLDSKTSSKILNLLLSIKDRKKTIIIVTHSPYVASHADKVLFIKDGVIFNQISKGNDSTDTFLNSIIMAQSTL